MNLLGYLALQRLTLTFADAKTLSIVDLYEKQSYNKLLRRSSDPVSDQPGSNHYSRGKAILSLRYENINLFKI